MYHNDLSNLAICFDTTLVLPCVHSSEHFVTCLNGHYIYYIYIWHVELYICDCQKFHYTLHVLSMLYDSSIW